MWKTAKTELFETKVMCACPNIHPGPRQCFVLKFIRIGEDGEILENDTKTIV